LAFLGNWVVSLFRDFWSIHGIRWLFHKYSVSVLECLPLSFVLCEADVFILVWLCALLWNAYFLVSSTTASFILRTWILLESIHSTLVHGKALWWFCWDWCLDKQNPIYPHNGILLGHKKEWNTDANQVIDEPWKYYAKWNEQETKHHILYDSTYIICPE
jgi:hypothetical protein